MYGIFNTGTTKFGSVHEYPELFHDVLKPCYGLFPLVGLIVSWLILKPKWQAECVGFMNTKIFFQVVYVTQGE